MNLKASCAAASVVALVLAGCAVAAPGAKPSGPARAGESDTVKTPQGDEHGVANLPFARGRVFARLDDYLAYLRSQSAYDAPSWREVEPGIYERGGRRAPDEPPPRLTRRQLMEKYGFKE
jgi:hypothetical protein